jgi:hypothetical protein
VIKIVAGDFSTVWPMTSFINGKFRLLPNDRMNPETFDVGELKTLEVVSEATVKKLHSSLAWAAAGGALFGPAGAIVGSVAGGNKNEVTFLGEFRDGRAFIAITDPGTWAKIRMAAARAPVSPASANPRRSGEQSPDIFVKAYANAVDPVIISLILVVASVLLFAALIGFLVCLFWGGPTSVFGWSSVVLFAIVGASGKAMGVRKT